MVLVLSLDWGNDRLGNLKDASYFVRLIQSQVVNFCFVERRFGLFHASPEDELRRNGQHSY